MMLYLTLSLCAVVCTFFVGRFFAAKTRLVEKTIDETIARKLSTSALNIELLRLKEENGVMRNLLIDMVENEASVVPAKIDQSVADKKRAMDARTQRRREIFGEAIYALQHTGGARSNAANVRIPG